MKKILVTAALPYANGNLHIGHMLEFIQADIWIRYNKILGNKCFYISGVDSHGTPIMIKANSEDKSFESIVNNYYVNHKTELKKFSISLNLYDTTNSYENELLSKKIYRKLYEKNFIFEKKINQFYDKIYNIFLPDRYIVGICPYCKSEKQTGDVCDSCNAKYDAIDLLNPTSSLSKLPPIKKQTSHFFFDLKIFSDFLKSWCLSNISQKSIVNKLSEWLDFGLKEWDISRDYPYFGFKIPGESKKYFYVWLDAPIGYFSFFLKFLLSKDLIYFNCFRKEIKSNEIYHFIGKDIVYFHALFWPSILFASNFNIFKDLFVHGFVTTNSLKMSKSNNTFINAEDFLGLMDSDCLRFYLASKLNSFVLDIDFNFLDFSNKINSDLVSKFFNIMSRCSKIVVDNYNGVLSNKLDSCSMFYEYLNLKENIFNLYNKREYNKVISYIMKYCDKINTYLDFEKPWILLKSKKTYNKGHEVCTTAINLFIILFFYLSPIIPRFFNYFQNILKFKIDHTITTPFLNFDISNYKHILFRY